MRKLANGLAETFDLIVVGCWCSSATWAEHFADGSPKMLIAHKDAGPLDKHPLGRIPFSARVAPAVVPVTACASAGLGAHVDAYPGTAYHPVGACVIGSVLDRNLTFDGLSVLWLANASVMPRITSANINAPPIVMGHRAARLINQQLKTQ